jgi:TonB family protein
MKITPKVGRACLPKRRAGTDTIRKGGLMSYSGSSVKAILIALVILVTAISTARAQQPPDKRSTGRAMAEKIRVPIIEISGKDAKGQAIPTVTGFFVRSELIVTYYYAVKDAVKIHVRIDGKEIKDAAIAAMEIHRFAAFIKVPGVFGNPLSFPCGYERKAEEKAFVFGSSKDSEGAVWPVTIKDNDLKVNKPVQALQGDTSGATTGSPIVNEEGFVAGMFVQIDVRDRKMNGIIRDVRPVAITRTTTLGCRELPRLHFEPDAQGMVGRDANNQIRLYIAFDLLVRESNAPKDAVYKTEKELANSVLRRAEPFYPQLVKDAGISGPMVLEVVIDEQGDVISDRRLSGHPLLHEVASDAARAWKFPPTLIDGVPVKVVSTITFDFVLDESK